MKLFSILSLLFIPYWSFAQGNFESFVTGNWGAAGTWTLVSGSDADGIPDADDNVTIKAGHTVTMNGNPGACLSLTINGTATWAAARTTNVGLGGIIINSGGNITGTFAGILTTTGGLTINAILTSATVIIKTQTTAGQTISGTGTLANLDISANTTNNGNITVTTTLASTTASALTQGNGSYLTIGAATVVPTLTAGTCTNTVKYNSTTLAQTVRLASYCNLIIDCSGQIATLGGATTVNGDLTVTAGTLADGGFLITGNVTGTFSVASGASYTTTRTATPWFPTLMTITLDNNSTVNFNGTTGFTLPATPAVYGNLGIGGGAVIKTASAPLTINGACTVSAGTFNTGSFGITIAGNLAGAGTYVNAANSTTNIGGSATVTTLTATAVPNTVNYNSTTASQTVKGTTYYNLETHNTGQIAIFGANPTINNNLNVVSGTLRTGAFTVLVTGTTTIDGTLGVNSATGTKTFGNLIINATGTFNNPANEAIAITGNLQNDGTFNSGTAAYTLSGAGSTISGTNLISIASLTLSGTYSNSGNLTVTTTFAGAGTLTQNNGSYLTTGAATVVPTLTAGTCTNTVKYNSTTLAQTVRLASYCNLIIDCSGQIATLGGATTVNGDLTVTAGTLADGGFQITGTASGIFSVANGASYTTTRTATSWFPTSMTTFSLANNSTVNFNGATGFTLPAIPATYGNLSIAGGAVIKTASSILTINGACTVTAGTFNTGGFGITIAGNLAGAGTYINAAGSTTNIGGNATVTTLTATAVPNTVNYNSTTIAQTVIGTTYYNLETHNSGQIATFGANPTINNNLNVVSGTLQTGAFTVSVTGTTTIDGTLDVNSVTGTKTFGNLTINSTGTFNNSANEAIAVTGNLQNDGAFTSGTAAYTLSGTTKTISGTNLISIASLTLSGTYSNSGNLTVTTTFAGAGTLTQNNGSYLTTGAATVVPTLTAGTCSNTVKYNSTTLAQTVRLASYCNLIIDCSGQIATLGGAPTVYGDLTVTAGTLADGGFLITGNVTGTFSVASGASYTTTRIATPWFPTPMATITLDNNSTVNFNGTTGFTLPATPATYSNLSIAGAVTKTLGGALAINGTLTLTSGILAIAGYDLTLGTSASITGTFSNANMITSTGGNIIKQFTSVPLAFTVFPLGTTGVYTPATIAFSAATFGGTGSISIRAIAAKAPNQFDNTNSLVKYWTITTSNISSIDATLDFTYDQTEADATYEPAGSYVGGYYPGIAPWEIGTDDYTNNIISFTETAVSNLTGNWTAGTEYGLNGTNTYYSRATGNWETNTTWSTISHLGAAAATPPPDGSTVDIGGGFTVTKTTSTALSITTMQIDATGTLNMGTQTGLTISTLNGDGIIQLASGTFPTVTTNNFLTTTGSTVEYNTATSFTLPLTPASYMNLLISTGGTKTLGSAIIINENCNITAGTLANGGYTITLKGNLTNAGTFSGTGKIYLNSGSASHTISGVGTFGNLELDDTQGASWSGTGITAASGNVTVTNGTLSLGAFTTSLTINGTTTINVNGTLSITSTTGTHNFGDVTVNGIWSDAINEPVTISGNLTVNTGATFTAGTGVYTLSGATKTIGGTITSFTIDNLTVTGTYTNNILTTGLSVSTALAGAGTLTQGTNSFLNIGGTSLTIVLTTTTNTPNTVSYTSAVAQNVKSTDYYHLTFTGAGTKTLLGAITVNGDLTVSAGTLADGGFQITGTAPGTFSVASGASYTTTRIATPWFPTLMATITLDNNSTVNFNGATGFTLPATPATYGNLSIAGGAVIKTASAPLTINGACTVTAGTFNTGGFGITIAGNLAGAGTYINAINSTTNIGGNATVTTLTATAVPNTVNYNSTTASQTVKGTIYYNLETNNTGQIATFGANPTINNNLNIVSGTLQTGAFTVSVTGTTTIDGTLDVNSVTGTKTFGNLTINSTGTFTNSANEIVAITGNLQNDGAFTSGTAAYTLSGTTKTISGTNLISIASLTLSGTYANSGNLTVTTTFAGAGTLTQNNGSYLTTGAATVVPTLAASTNSNTVKYNSTTLAQTVKATPYYHLIIDCSGQTATLGGATTVNGNLTVSTGTLADGGFQITGTAPGIFYVAPGASYTSTRIATPWFPTLMTTITLDNNSTVNFNGTTGFTLPATPATYSNLSIAGAVTKTLGGALAINGTLTLTSGILAIAGFDLTLGTSGAIAGTFSATNMITSTGGNIIKQFTSVPLAFTVFPLGTGTVYTPATIAFTAATFGGTGSISIRAIAAKAPNQVDNTNSLSKYWTITTSNISGIDATLDFTYDQTEADATYEPAGSYVGGYNPGTAPPWEIGADDYTLNIISFTKTAASSLSGDWTAGREYGLNGTTTYYSRATGNWETITTWSTISHTGAAATSSPPADSNVDIGGGFTVTKTSSAALSINLMQIDPTGTLNMGTQTGLTISTLNGDGIIQLASGTFPTVTTNNFNTTSGSTVVYNTAGSFTLPASPASYMNLTVSTGGTKTLGADITVNENLNILTTATLADGGFTLNVKGNVTNNSTHSGSGKIYLNGTSAQTISGATSTFGNIESDNSAGTAFSGTGTTTVSGNVTVTNGTLSLGAFTTSLTVNGATTVAASQTLSITSTTGTHKFGDVTVNGIWSNAINEPIAISGNLTVNTGATFTAGTGVYTLSGATKTIGGTITSLTIDRVSVTGTYTNNILTTGLTVSTALAGAGTLTQGTNSFLNIGGTSLTIVLTTTTNTPNTVSYTSAAAQNVKSTTYYHLSFTGAGTKTLLGAITVNRDLTVSAGTLADGGYQITGNATGTMSMAAGTGLTLGTATTATAFPANFITGNIALNTSTVNYNSNAVQSISGVPTYGNLTLTATAGVIKTAGAAVTVNGDLTIGANNTLADGGFTITAKGNVTNNGTHSGAGRIYLNGGSVSHTISDGTSAYGNVELADANGATWSGSAATTVSGTLTVTTGTLSLDAFTTSITVNGATTVAASQTLSITSTTGTHNFDDVTVNGTWSDAINEAIAISGNLTVNTGATFTAGTGIYTLSGAGKTIGGTITSLTIGNLTLTGTYTNNILTTGLTVSTALAGAGTLTQGTNSFLNIGGTSLLTGLTTTTNTPNTVVYNGSGAQTIKVPTLSTYYHLTISSSNTASLGGATTVNGNLTVTAGTLADAGFQITGTAPGIFNVAPGASYTTTRIATPWFPTLMTISLDNNSTVNFNGTTGFTLPATPATYSNLSIAGAVTKTLGGALAINGTLTLTSGILAIAGYDITLGTSGTIAGTFSTSNMITSTGGNIIKQFTSVPLAFTVFPLGTGTVYTPATIAFTAATFGGTGSISIRAIAAKAPNQFDNTNSLSKYWTITTSNISGINATLDFTYDQAEADATYEPAGSYVGGYWPESTPWEIGTDDYTLNIISFTKTAASKLTGNWTAGTEYGLNGTNTYYSRATGNWEINTTWSTISHLGAAAGTTPPTGSNVDIGGGFTVTKTTSTALSITTMQIDANGTLDMGTQTGLTISTLNGDGKIQLASGTFPTVTTNNFIATSGSTVEYNGASFTLPASPASYMNLTISAGGTKTLSSAIIINENCNISAGTLADGGYTITLKGNLTNAGTFSGTGKIYLNSGSASHTISGVGTFGNLELNDTQGASWSGTGTTTVSGNVTVTTGTLSLGTFTSIITISGTTTINGTLSITSATGTKSFSDLIIGATGAFNNNTVNQAVTLTGNLQNNGTFTSGTAAYTFSGANKILSGTNPISIGTASSSGALTNNGTFNVTTFTAGNTFANNGTVSVSALTCNGAYTNNVTTTVSGATFAGSSSFTQGINSTLNTAITPTVTTLSASNSGNTVNYTGSGINVKSTTYYNLKISNTGTKTLAGAITVNGDLTIDGGTLASSTFQISGNVTLASKFTMAAGTAFTLGLTTSATCPQFPTNITTGNITLDPASSVTYQCNSATDVISVTPAYGNLYITNGNTILTKTLSSTPLNINGNFDITDGSSALTVAVGANTVNIGGNLTGNAASTLSTGTINIGGSNNSYTGTVTIGNSLVNFNGTGPQSVKALTYYNLKVDKSSGTASLTGTTAAGGYLTIANGTLSTGANQLSVTGDMTISAGTLSLADNNFTVSGNSSITGNINFTSATGTKSFNGNVVLNNGGVWNASAAIPVTINGNLQNDGAFTANSGAYTFTGLAKTMSGANSLSFDNVAINIGATYTATTNTTITTALAGAGSLAVGADNSLTLGGTCTVTTFIPENNNATVYFNSATAGQTVPATTYFNLVIDKTDQTATAGGNITVSNDLTVTSGGLTVGANNISVAGITNIDGTLTLSSATGTKAFGDLNINSTGTLTNSGNANVTVNGNFLNDGTFTTPGSGAYIFAGAGKSIQGSNGFTNMNGIISGTITYNCATNSSFGTLNVSGVAAQLTIASDRGLDINTSYTNSGTTLVDASPNGHSGSLKTPATITNTGTCSFKTSIAKNKWHCISSSVTNAQIQAVFTDLASHNNNFYRYDETSAAGYWVQQTTGTMNPGQGYYLYYFNNKYKTYSSANSTYNTGNINVPLTYTAGGRLGWNFVGNPYPSAVDWDAAGWTKTNMEDAVYIKNGSGWDSYVGGVGDCRYIYPGQGFFVKALSGGGTLGFSNSVRLHRTSDNLKNTKENNSVTDPVLKLSLGNDTSVNNTYIRFKDDATAGYNGKWDAYKVFSEVEEYPELYSLTSSFDSLSINSTPFISKDTIIPLGIKTGAPGAYKIKAEQILNFGENIDIFLEDITTGTYTNLKEDSSYTFSSGIINNANRFNLRFIKNNSLVPSEPVKNKFSVTQPFYNGNEIWIIVNYSSEKQIRVDLYDLSGKRIYTNNFTIENESQFISIKFNSLSAGMYLLKISNSREALVKKFITLGY